MFNHVGVPFSTFLNNNAFNSNGPVLRGNAIHFGIRLFSFKTTTPPKRQPLSSLIPDVATGGGFADTLQDWKLPSSRRGELVQPILNPAPADNLTEDGRRRRTEPCPHHGRRAVHCYIITSHYIFSTAPWSSWNYGQLMMEPFIGSSVRFPVSAQFQSN